MVSVFPLQQGLLLPPQAWAQPAAPLGSLGFRSALLQPRVPLNQGALGSSAGGTLVRVWLTLQLFL